jgi:hypothetical protein
MVLRQLGLRMSHVPILGYVCAFGHGADLFLNRRIFLEPEKLLIVQLYLLTIMLGKRLLVDVGVGGTLVNIRVPVEWLSDRSQRCVEVSTVSQLVRSLLIDILLACSSTLRLFQEVEIAGNHTLLLW